MTETKPAHETALTKFDTPTLKGMRAVAPANTQIGFLPQNMGEAMEMAKLMAVSSFVPPHLRGKAGDCLAIVIQATRWELDPFAVASKSYFVNDRPAFEAQLIHAVVNARAPLQKRLRETYEGQGPTRRCKVAGMIKGETEPLEYVSPTFAEITPKNSPLWKADPDQQLHYFAVRAWARRYVPEVLLGIYTREELESGPQQARDITPRPERDDPGYEVYDETGVLIETVYSPEEWKAAYTAAKERAGDEDSFKEANYKQLLAFGLGIAEPANGSAQSRGEAIVRTPSDASGLDTTGASAPASTPAAISPAVAPADRAHQDGLGTAVGSASHGKPVTPATSRTGEDWQGRRGDMLAEYDRCDTAGAVDVVWREHDAELSDFNASAYTRGKIERRRDERLSQIGAKGAG